MPKATVGMDSGLLTPSATYTRASVLPVNTDTWSSVSGSRRKLPQIPRSAAVSSESVATVVSSPGTTPSTRLAVTGGNSGIPNVTDTPHRTTCVGSILPTVVTASCNSSVTPTSMVAFQQPPGFKELRERVSKFAGDGKEDFEVWLADYCEATGDCGWTDQLRARWFSWFLTGAAKNTWQRTLNAEDKATWASIVLSYKGHYGVHLDPRTAYLRCHELQYSDFSSVQGLLEAMKDYQHKVPDQLSNDNLISILWNKVPFKLQKEVGEIKDWSLQELLQRLLRAESQVEECERRTNQTGPR